jgi:hypothetical protein
MLTFNIRDLGHKIKINALRKITQNQNIINQINVRG